MEFTVAPRCGCCFEIIRALAKYRPQSKFGTKDAWGQRLWVKGLHRKLNANGGPVFDPKARGPDWAQ
jgi:hypothetical protein